MQDNEQAAISTVLQPPKDCGRLLDDVFPFLSTCKYLENFFHHNNSLH